MTPKHSGYLWILVFGSKVFGPVYLVSSFNICLSSANNYHFSMCNVGFLSVGNDKTTYWTGFPFVGSPIFDIFENYAFEIG